MKSTQKLPALVLVIALSIALFRCIESGSDPIPGADGLSALIEMTSEPSGANCTSGGTKITIGQDLDEDGVLDAGEIKATSFICNGSADNLMAVTSELVPDENCETGGVLVEIGADLDGSESLEPEEIQTSYFICNGSTGANSLMTVSPEAAGSNCSAGGTKVEVGLDANANGTLDVEEVSSTSYICNGENGLSGTNSLVRVDTEPAGTNCSTGGLAVFVGLDSDNDGVLSDTEIIGAANYICNGSDGNNGANGNDGRSPIVVSAPSSSCSNGGTELIFGYDDNGDGSLNATDDTILETLSVCDGIDGINTLISTSTSGINCENGGVRIEFGPDTNGNNVLDTEEITANQEICNGIDGSNSLVKLTTLSVGNSNCSGGGVRVEVGIDADGDGVLDLSEIDNTQTSYVCNGSSDGIYEFYFTQGVDGYTGVVECTMDNYAAELTTDSLIAGYFPSAVIGVASGRTNAFALPTNASSFLPLLRFEGLESIASEISGSYHVVEATLYVYGSLASTYSGNRLAVSHLNYPADNILFGTDATVAQKTATPTITTWINGNFSIDDQGPTYDMFDMLQRGTSDTTFVGYIPLALDRSSVDQWIAGQNHGVALALIDDIIEGSEILFIENSNVANLYHRPTLYIKVKELATAGRSNPKPEDEYKNWWSTLSYEEKLGPLKRR
ncbi:DUF7151 family protein [Reichenbachiella ulvae]|uniref:DUF7151 domain-containing protein n=1 Tax=Reichenbachiella ulvae TaxID=2980104 RepID=A0ABT3D0S0_9BACT|nr:hypothetical protein [Reichenbachiella ulvae]MCV9389408.1 hypothetical protein [Reichenbachiella ulvae]